MIPLRARLSAIVIAATMLLTGAAPLLANDPACLTHQHDCSETAHLRSHCCLEVGGGPNEATPPASKTEIAQPVADGTMVITNAPIVPSGLLQHARALATAPRSSPPDLITLFGTFLL